MNTLDAMNRVFPFLGWFKHYNFQSLRVDALAGLTVALVLIPQSMAYAQLAGLPAYYGLYASFLPPPDRGPVRFKPTTLYRSSSRGFYSDSGIP